MKYAIDHKHMMMFSDFAVKALLNDWDEKLLGPKAFCNLGECDSFLNLNFIPGELKECCSSQLQMVGQLSEKGESTIHALSGTVVFGMNKDFQKEKAADIYECQILTIVTKTCVFNIETVDKAHLCKIKDKEGSIGHALIKYKTGALLLLSAGHWVELKNLNVDVNNLEKIAKMNYGENNMFME